MDHIDFVGLAGLVVGMIALGVAVYGVRDVREQVRALVTLERNRVFAKEVKFKAEQLVKLIGDVQRFQSDEMHGLSMLARVLDPTQTLDAVQEYTNKEALRLAQEYVQRGWAIWRDHIDESRVAQVLNDWQNDKNRETLRQILGSTPLTDPQKNLPL